MPQDLTPIMSLIARGLVAAGAMFQLDRVYQQYPTTRLDGEMEVKYVANKAEFAALAAVLSRRTMNASAADMEMALRHACQSSFSDYTAWTTLIQKLSASAVTMDQEMAKALGVFA
jgi:hypothetical protein